MGKLLKYVMILGSYRAIAELEFALDRHMSIYY
jgi:hypothetical protein